MDNNQNRPRRNVERRENTQRSNESSPQSSRREQPVSPNVTSQPRNEPSQQRNNNSNSGMANKKKILIALGLLGGIAAIAGISEMISNIGKVMILKVQTATITAQQPFQDCGQVRTTSYSNYHKNGTEGAVIGGVGGGVVGALVSHSWVGLAVGAAVGGVGGDLVQRSYQPNIVAHHGVTTQCHLAYRPVQVPIGYNVEYMDNNNQTGQIVTQHQPPIGQKIAMDKLQSDQVSEQQQQEIVQQYINAGNNNQ